MPVCPEELAELHVRPRERRRLPGRGVDRVLHRARRTRHVAEELARVRHARVGADTGLERNHVVERRERAAVAAELDLRVADDAVARRGRRRQAHRAFAEGQGAPELVTRGLQRAEADGCGQIVRREPQCPAVGVCRARVVGDVGRHAAPLRERVRTPVELGHDRRRRQRPRRGFVPAANDAAEEESGGGRRRRRSTDRQLRPHYGFCWPFVFSKPLNGSAW